jgi:mono/diheme cytochrome c family protein
VLAISLIVLVGWSAVTPPAPEFENSILPIFQANCLRCHAADIKMGGLNLGSVDGILRGSEKGAVLVPGNPEASKLYFMVRGGVMPLDKKTQVSDAEMETIRAWIQQMPKVDDGSSNAAPKESSSLTKIGPAVASDSPYRVLLDHYCVTCHNQQANTAGLALDKVDVANVSMNGAIWEKVIRKLRTGAMPPPGMPRPGKDQYASFATYLETALDRAAEKSPQTGTVILHRLNRAEYANAVRDLLDVRLENEPLLPADDSGYGFDNISAVLSVTPMLFERYMIAGKKVVRQAIGDPEIKQTLDTYDIPSLLLQNDQMSEELPFGSRGGIAIHHNFPVNGDYVIKIHLQRGGKLRDEQILGLGEPHQLEVRIDGTKLKTFTVGRENSDAVKSVSNDATKPASAHDSGSIQNSYEYTADNSLEVHFSAKAGSRLIAVYFGSENSEPEGPRKPNLAEFRFTNQVSSGRAEVPRTQDVLPAIAQVLIGGPLSVTGLGETPSRQKIFMCRPAGPNDELSCATKILLTLARRAYRRPVTSQDVQPLLKLYRAGSKTGGFEAGVAMALRGILISPDFLFRVERDPADAVPDTPYRISDLELASRLSFFIWSSIPDDELLNLAVKGRLKDPLVLEHQVRRMLADSRSNALIENFAGQWLYLRNMERVHPDPEAFPYFDETLRQSFEEETKLFLQSSLKEDQSVLNLLNANYTFLNERLAKFYGIPNVYGSRFRRVTLAGDDRSGLLGQGSILTVTSYANRTSPTIRGKWLLENFLGTPPPPPPPNVPSLKEVHVQNGRVLTMRERMEEHRKNPACAVCHTSMDPLGFALENFDGVGKWRVAEGGTPIDASGSLPSGDKFDGPAQLRTFFLNHPEQFVSTMSGKLLTYSLGRGLEYYDAPALRKILRDAAPHNYSWSSLILGVVNSVPFQMRTSASATKPKPQNNVVSQNQVPKESRP